VNDDLVDFTGGDHAAARLLRDNLAGLRDRLAGDPGAEELRRDLDAVLAGRLTLRELADVPAFRDLTQEGMREAQRAWQELSPEERARAVRDGAARSD
jgi:hypothetical protein